MIPWPKTALFMSGVFFGGAVDHLLAFALQDASAAHFPFPLPVDGQLVFGLMDAILAAGMFALHGRSTHGVSDDLSNVNTSKRPTLPDEL